MREKISACITAGNEEEKIERCLKSVTWADEIVVIDSFSTDDTVEICKRYTDRVYQHKWLGYIGQKNLAKDLAEGPWILFLDADEELSEELRDEILAEFELPECRDIAGYEFPRMVHYLGRWIRHGDWYPDVKLRLFRKELGRSGGKEPHDRIIVDGRVKRLKNCMYHYTYSDVSDQISTINRFSTITAIGQSEANRRFHLMDVLFRPLFRFLRGYFLRGGFLDGLPGLVVAVTTSFGVFIKYTKLWELQFAEGNERSAGAAADAGES